MNALSNCVPDDGGMWHTASKYVCYPGWLPGIFIAKVNCFLLKFLPDDHHTNSSGVCSYFEVPDVCVPVAADYFCGKLLLCVRFLYGVYSCVPEITSIDPVL